MVNIIDRRGKNKNKLAGSRRRFINRHNLAIRKAIEKRIARGRIESIAKDTTVVLDKIEEVNTGYSGRKNSKYVRSGNTVWNEGDEIRKQTSYGRVSGAVDRSGDLEEIIFGELFVLNREEFLDILFADLDLPNFTKESNKTSIKNKLKIGGYCKEGPSCRLAIKKTFENSMARKIALRNTELGKRFLDDIDLKYRNLILVEEPTMEATVFFVMDVSGSMQDEHRNLAKKFFFIFYLFLTKKYDKIHLRFIVHTDKAQECTEDQFFSTEGNGGTVVSSAIKLTNKLIDDEANSDMNYYVVQVSDGDNFSHDFGPLRESLEELLPKIQYFIYVEVEERSARWSKGMVDFYNEVLETRGAAAQLLKGNDVFEILRKLFYKK